MRTMEKKHLDKGLIHYLYGNGVGKTSSSFGIVLRSLGNNLNPIIIQFLKESNETSSGKKDGGQYEIHGLDLLKIDVNDIYLEYLEKMKASKTMDELEKTSESAKKNKMTKGFDYGEYHILNNNLHVPMIQLGTPQFIFTGEKPTQQQLYRVEFGLKLIEKLFQTDVYDVVVLDEIITAISLKMVPLEKALTLLKKRKPTIEVILTGREKIGELMDISDYITQFNDEKHPFKKGILARKGIEF
jgi:cob(I)alamin adenosyltransferase